MYIYIYICIYIYLQTYIYRKPRPCLPVSRKPAKVPEWLRFPTTSLCCLPGVNNNYLSGGAVLCVQQAGCLLQGAVFVHGHALWRRCPPFPPLSSEKATSY